MQSDQTKAPVKVSVMLSIYNTAPYLPAALDSVCSQTLREIEIICVNDGSPDNSLEILQEYALQDSRIRIISQKNAGQSAARNTAAHLAAGDWLYFMDSDDIIEPDMLETLVEYGESHDLEMVLTNTSVFADTPEWEHRAAYDYEHYYCVSHTYPDVYKGEDLFVLLWENHEFVSPAWMYLLRNEFRKKHDLRFRQGIQREDDLMQISCLLRAQRVGRVNRELIRHRIRSNSIITQKIRIDYIYSDILVIRDICGQLYGTPVSEKTYAALRNYLLSMVRQCVSDYDRLDEEERVKLPTLTQDLRMEIDLYAIHPHDTEHMLQQFETLQQERDTLRESYNYIHASQSYRIGRVLTAPLRKLRDLIKK